MPGSFQAPDYPGIMPVVDTLDLLVNPDSFELVLTTCSCGYQQL
ncbi:MAG: hypothetical protein R2787_04620 [Saprospiraceae bacterium]